MEDILDLFAGPGGWDRGAELAGIEPTRILGVEKDPVACATARAAGYRRLQADVLDLDPADYGHITGLIASPPCPTFSSSGKRTGLGDDYQRVLDAITHLGLEGGCDCPWEQILGEPLETVADQRTALVLQAVRFAFQLPALEWILLEQVPALEFMWEDIAAELYAADWGYVDVAVLDAADFGVPSRRRRAFLAAHRTRPFPIWLGNAAEVSVAQSLDWDQGEKIRTRNNRKPTGGNLFSCDGPAWCLTGSSRSWTRESTGEQLTPAQAGVLNGFPSDFPWQGSRTRRFLQVANVVAPPVAASILAQVPSVASAPVHHALAS